MAVNTSKPVRPSSKVTAGLHKLTKGLFQGKGEMSVDHDKLRAEHAKIKAGLSNLSLSQRNAVLEAHDVLFGAEITPMERILYETFNPMIVHAADGGVPEAIQKLDGFMAAAVTLACKETGEYTQHCPKATKIVEEAMERTYTLLAEKKFPKVKGGWH